MVTQLAIVKIDNKHYYQDDRLHEYRLTTNPHERIAFEDIGARKVEPVQQSKQLTTTKRKIR